VGLFIACFVYIRGYYCESQSSYHQTRTRKRLEMKSLFTRVTIAFVVAGLGLTSPALASREESSRLALEAKEALDADFGGNTGQLTRASTLLKRALSEDKTNANVYVQAARVAVKGGYIVSSRFQPGSIDAYGELLDQALELDPNNLKARILKAEYFHIKRDYASERIELDRAQAIRTNDPWLLIGYGRHFFAKGDADLARSYYAQARDQGVGLSVEHRKAYIYSLVELAGFAASADDQTSLREITQLVRTQRDKRDAWSLGNLSDALLRVGMFDEAITTAREALSVMDYGVGRLHLVAALYGKAAELTDKGSESAASPLIEEARSYRVDKSSVLRQFSDASPKTRLLLRTLGSLVK
jgi:tetratricopeptide (TPR) repeat protein